MAGLEVVVGFLVAWFARKAGRVGRQVDGFVDDALDAGLDRLHSVVAAKLGNDSAMTKLANEVSEKGEARPRTQDRVRLVLEDAAEEDPDFASALDAAVERIQNARDGEQVSAGDQGVAVAGGVQASHSGIAIGGVTGSSVVFGEPPNP